MTDYIIKIKDVTSIYHDIITIEFYETYIRMVDKYDIVYHLYTRDKLPVIIQINENPIAIYINDTEVKQ